MQSQSSMAYGEAPGALSVKQGFVVLYQLIMWVSVQGIHIRKFIMQSYPITATFFAERMRGVSLEVSERLQRRWREVGLLDEHGFSNTMDGEALG